MTDPAQLKQKMREKLRFRRRHFAANLDDMARFAAFRALPAPLTALIEAQPMVAAYAAWCDEPDILPMLSAFADEGTLTLPHHEGRIETMSFRRWGAGDALVKGPWSSRQPADDSESASPTLLFCPLLGFDRRGGRLGQGGGHYDRYFAAHPDALRIGVGWSVQEIDAVPLEATDMILDAILTEQEYIITGDRL